MDAEAAAAKLSQANSKYNFVVLSHGLERALDPVGVLQTALGRLRSGGFLVVIGSDTSPDSLLYTPLSEEDLKKRHAGSVTAEEILARRYLRWKRSDTPQARKRIDDQVKQDAETFAVLNHWSGSDAVSLLKTGFSLLGCSARIVCEVPGSAFDGAYAIFVTLEQDVKKAKRMLFRSFSQGVYVVRPDLQTAFPEVAERSDWSRFISWMKEFGLSVDGFKPYISLFADVLEEPQLDFPGRKHNTFDPIFTRIIGDDKCLGIGFDSLADLLPVKNTEAINIEQPEAPAQLAGVTSKYPFVLLDRCLDESADPAGALQSALALVEEGGILAVCGMDAPESTSHALVTGEELAKLHKNSAAQGLLSLCPSREVPENPVVFRRSFGEMESLLKNSFRLLGLSATIVYALPGELFGGFHVFFILPKGDGDEAGRIFLRRFCKALYAVRPDLQAAFPEFGERDDWSRFASWLKGPGLTSDGHSRYLRPLEEIIKTAGL